MIALVRTGDKEESGRHGGMSQFIIDLSLPGVTIRPIADLSGNEHFNEVFFDNVQLDNDALIGAEGNGWGQVTAELAFERSGPELCLGSMPPTHKAMAPIGKRPVALQAGDIGRITARLVTLRNMSLAVTQQLSEGQNPAWAAACVKDLGNVFDQDLPEILQLLVEDQPQVGGGSDHAQVLDRKSVV